MTKKKQRMSYTNRPLYHRESVLIARLYNEHNDWNAVRDEIIENNLLQTRTVKYLKVMFQDISSRLKLLPGPLLDFLVNGSHHEQRHVLWLAVCLRHRFIYDFAVEVVREKFLSLNDNLTYDDYELFFTRKSEWHEELEKLSRSSVDAMRQTIFRIMREVQILTADHTIQPVLLSARLHKTIKKHAPQHLAVFPLSEPVKEKLF